MKNSLLTLLAAVRNAQLRGGAVLARQPATLFRKLKTEAGDFASHPCEWRVSLRRCPGFRKGCASDRRGAQGGFLRNSACRGLCGVRLTAPCQRSGCPLPKTRREWCPRKPPSGRKILVSGKDPARALRHPVPCGTLCLAAPRALRHPKVSRDLAFLPLS